jgi:hypothetical protein
MHNIFTSEEYAGTHFIYDFCNGSGTAAVVEYQQQYSIFIIANCKTFEDVCRILKGNAVKPRHKCM